MCIRDRPVILAIQVFDMKDKGQIVVVGDEPSVGAIGKPVSGVIAGGTGTLTPGPMEGSSIPVKVVLDIER